MARWRQGFTNRAPEGEDRLPEQSGGDIPVTFQSAVCQGGAYPIGAASVPEHTHRASMYAHVHRHVYVIK